ncbi:MAG TPA: Na+/H+ antiporter NhaC family protein [Vicinamibacteria bacterium]|nr:Na+/H+ antiporter NhaC family protein [Vicinamibacteria bacterium]
MRRCAFATALLAAATLEAQPAVPQKLEVDPPGIVLAGVPFKLTVRATDAEGNAVQGYGSTPQLEGFSATATSFEDGKLEIEDAIVPSSGRHLLRVLDGPLTAELTVRAIPAFFSILPPVLAITLALAFRQVVLSLFAGIWLAAFFVRDYNPLSGFFAVVTHFLVNAITTTSQAQIVIFSFLFGGMVGVISRNGGARGIAELITRYATNARGGQVATMAMALVMFFDDYANVLVRGNLMRPITDRLRISREKLSFLVDTGAAAVASTVLISTWIGYEVGLIEQGLRIIDSPEDAYSMFVRTIPYRFYPILAMVFAFLVGFSDRDFGPMLRAERRARFEGKVIRDGAQPVTESLDDPSDTTTRSSWFNGLAPIVTILVVGLGGIYYTGIQAAPGETDIGNIVAASDSYVALLWASLSGCAVAIGLAVARRILTMAEAFDAWIRGLKSMMIAIVILVLAWSIGAATAELRAADYLVQILEGTLNPVWLPVLTFVVSAAMAFATGTSWATMAIMMPLVIPLASVLGTSAGLSPDRVDTILVGVISSVLAGAVFGDHCSPISDTTILSSMASSSDHIDHVRTQLPYALLVAIVGMFLGDIPTAYGLSPWISILLGSVTLLGVLMFFGKPVGAPETEENEL